MPLSSLSLLRHRPYLPLHVISILFFSFTIYYLPSLIFFILLHYFTTICCALLRQKAICRAIYTFLPPLDEECHICAAAYLWGESAASARYIYIMRRVCLRENMVHIFLLTCWLFIIAIIDDYHYIFFEFCCLMLTLLLLLLLHAIVIFLHIALFSFFLLRLFFILHSFHFSSACSQMRYWYWCAKKRRLSLRRPALCQYDAFAEPIVTLDMLASLMPCCRLFILFYYLQRCFFFFHQLFVSAVAAIFLLRLWCLARYEYSRIYALRRYFDIIISLITLRCYLFVFSIFPLIFHIITPPCLILFHYWFADSHTLDILLFIDIIHYHYYRLIIIFTPLGVFSTFRVWCTPTFMLRYMPALALYVIMFFHHYYYFCSMLFMMPSLILSAMPLLLRHYAAMPVYAPSLRLLMPFFYLYTLVGLLRYIILDILPCATITSIFVFIVYLLFALEIHYDIISCCLFRSSYFHFVIW